MTTSKITVIKPSISYLNRIKDLWKSREVFYSLLAMEYKVRYRQTYLGLAWAILQPVIAMAIFTITFGYVAKFSSKGLPYSLFALSGLVVWYYMFNSIQYGSMTVLDSADLIRQVSFPRIYFPLSIIISKLLDFMIAFAFFAIYAAFLHPIYLGPELFLAPIYCIFGVLLISGFTVGLAALCANFKDVKFLIPYLTQILFFSTPIVYVIPDYIFKKYPMVVWLNPFTIWIMGFRQSLFSGQNYNHIQSLSALFVWMIFSILFGYLYFFKIEKNLSDRI